MTDTKSDDVKKKQNRNLAIFAIGALLLLIGIYYLVSEKAPVKKEEKPQMVSIATPVQHVDEVSYWVEKAQNKFSEEVKKTDTLKKQLESLSKTKEQEAQMSKDQYAQMENEIKQLKEEITKKNKIGVNINNANNVGMSDINTDILNLSSSRETENDQIPARNPDNFVPSGTFAKAVMIGGADAAAGAMSQSNPTPLIFRITEQGTLPNNQKSHLKDCVVTAAVIGDISSERGQIRLERMSCVKPSNEVIEMSVEGTVFGPEGKNGIRGKPLWREGALLARAAVAGTLSGFSEGISNQYTTSSISPLGSTETVNTSDIFKYGAASGASNAMDKLAEYNIRRAEQYHPVIQLSAGTVVDVVFLKGFYLDNKKHSENETVINQSVNKTEEQYMPNIQSDHNRDQIKQKTPLTLSDEQAAKIKAHEQAMGF